MTDMMRDGHGWWMGGGMWLLSALFWMLIIAGVVLIVKWAMTRKGEGSFSESPLDILKKRYARGEIDRETFERMKRDIEGGSS